MAKGVQVRAAFKYPDTKHSPRTQGQRVPENLPLPLSNRERGSRFLCVRAASTVRLHHRRIHGAAGCYIHARQGCSFRSPGPVFTPDRGTGAPKGPGCTQEENSLVITACLPPFPIFLYLKDRGERVPIK